MRQLGNVHQPFNSGSESHERSEIHNLGHGSLDNGTDWKALLAEGLGEDDLEALRRHARTGRPLGAARWVKRLEKRLARSLAPRKAGRKPKAEQAAGGAAKK